MRGITERIRDEVTGWREAKLHRFNRVELRMRGHEVGDLGGGRSFRSRRVEFLAAASAEAGFDSGLIRITPTKSVAWGIDAYGLDSRPVEQRVEETGAR